MKDTTSIPRPSLLNLARNFFRMGRLTDGAKSPAAQEPKASRKNLNVLLVDDDPVFLKVTAARLDGEGYDVTTAADGCEAIRALRAKIPDLVVLDMDLPSDVSGVPWNGKSLTTWLQRFEPFKDIPVVMVSGGDANKYGPQSLSAGAKDFFHKQRDSQILLKMVARALARKDRPNSNLEPGFQI
jgi:CheY-like chemotaxis protein